MKDHVIPEKVPAKIKTLEFVHALPTSTFKVQFEDLGNVPVVEYGIALSKGISGQLEPLPTVANEVLIFTSLPIDLNIKTQGYIQSFADTGPMQSLRMELLFTERLLNTDFSQGDIALKLTGQIIQILT